jgi:hypothetical protein
MLQCDKMLNECHNVTSHWMTWQCNKSLNEHRNVTWHLMNTTIWHSHLCGSMDVITWNKHSRMLHSNIIVDECLNVTKIFMNATMWHHVLLTWQCDKTLNEHCKMTWHLMNVPIWHCHYPGKMNIINNKVSQNECRNLTSRMKNMSTQHNPSWMLQCKKPLMNVTMWHHI